MTIHTQRPTGRAVSDPPTDRSLRRAVVAGVVLVALALGVPALLIALGRALPIDVTSLGIGALARPDDGSLLLVALLAIAWVAWSVVILSLGLEMWSAARRTPTPRIPGLGAPQRLAAALVASLALGVATGVATDMAPGRGGSGEPGGAYGMGTGPMPASRPSLTALVRAAARAPGFHVQASGGTHPEDVQPRVAPGGATGGAANPGSPDPGPTGAGATGPDVPASHPRDLPTITTQRHDTLWLLAEQHLGNGARYQEIVELNAGVPQADGRTLAANGRIYPGWTLRLPADADLRADRPARHRVAAGDTLWDIADERLGDPNRYPELFDANVGDRQPDGRRLVEPDLIHPGWVLELPDADSAGRELADRERAGAEPQSTEPEPAEPESMEPESRAPAPDEQGMRALDRALPGTHATPEPNVTGAADGPSGPRAAQPSAASPRTLDRVPAKSESAPPTPAAAPALPDRDDAPSGDDDDAGDGEATPDGEATSDATDVPQAAFLAPAGGTLGALLLAALIRELARRRRQFQRHRRPGENMSTPDEAARELEALAVDALADDGSELLERALMQVGVEADRLGVRLPRVRTVRVSGATIHLDLAADAAVATPIAPFIARSDLLWELDPDLLAAPAPVESPVESSGQRTAGSHAAGSHAAGSPDAQADGAPDPRDVIRPFPGLVTIGVRGEDTVLVDTEEIGTLRISGPPDAVPGVLRAMASELALGLARDVTSRTLCLTDLALSEAIVAAMEAGELAVEDDPARLAGILTAAQNRGSSTFVPGDPSDPVELALTDRALGVDVVGRAGTALITTDPACPAGAVLELDGRGGGVLQPDGLALVPQTLGASSAAALASALAATHVPADLPSDPGSDPPPAPRPDPPPAPPPAPPSVAVPAGGVRTAPRVLLLGELLVENARGRAESTRIGRLAETTAFVLLNPGARPSALQSALWPGRRGNPQTCRQMISRTRTWLGRTEAGDSYLLPFAETQGRLHLRPEVGSDWAEFQHLAAAGLADPDDVELLDTALGLVRGRPFGPVAAREIPWADLAINDMICLITDVAHELATRHERAGRIDAARRAALIGLRTESESEVLTAIVARTSASR